MALNLTNLDRSPLKTLFVNQNNCISSPRGAEYGVAGTSPGFTRINKLKSDIKRRKE